MGPSKRIVVLISGRGSNLQALLEAARTPNWPGQVVAVLSNRPDAPGLDVARAFGVSTQALDHRASPSREAYDESLLTHCEAHAPDVVVLAGFMRVLGDRFVRHYAGRLINIHPSLLPAFEGLHTHRRALQAGVKWAGATVHYVTPALDQGPIIAQAAVPVRADDDEARLAERVLRAEHRLLPMALAWHLNGELEWHDGVVRHRGGAPQWLITET